VVITVEKEGNKIGRIFAHSRADIHWPEGKFFLLKTLNPLEYHISDLEATRELNGWFESFN